MSVIINHKICDQAGACGGISKCPFGVFSYNADKKKIELDNNKCISCGLCVGECPIGAIAIANTKEEYEKLETMIEQDPRSAEDLFVDRYGADIISENIMINYEDIGSKINTKKTIIIELFSLNSAECLIKSIPISEIKEATKVDIYYRCEITNMDLSKYSIKNIPAILVFENGKLINKIEGFYEEKNKYELFKLLK